MVSERPEEDGSTPDTLDNPPTETAPREETVWEQLTRDRLEEVHSFINRVIFNTIGYFPYGIIARMTVRPKEYAKAGPLKGLPYQTRLKIYNTIHGVMEYGHYISTLLLMLAATVPYGESDDLEYLRTVMAYALPSALLARHIAYNRRRVKRIIDAVKKRDERKEEKAEVLERKKARNRRRKERRKGQR